MPSLSPVSEPSSAESERTRSDGAPAATEARATRRQAALVCASLVLVVAALYAPVTGFGFTSYDDPGYVAENALVKRGLTREGVAWAFSTFALANWHPLTWLSYMIDCSLFGPDAGALHRTGVALHAANAALLYLVLRTITLALWPSVLIALLFAVHPLNVESVAWIAERKNVLSLCFGLLALLAHARFAQRPSALRQAVVALALALGLLAKPVLVTLPFLMLVLDAWPLRRVALLDRTIGAASVSCFPRHSPAALIREKWPLFVLVVASCVVTVSAARAGGATSMIDVSFFDRIAAAIVAYVDYLANLVAPHDLAVVYPHPKVWPLWQVGVDGVVLLLISALASRERRRTPVVLVGWLWFLGTGVPTIGIVQVGLQWKADRYAYLPAIGVFLAAAGALVALVQRCPRLRAPAIGAAVVALLAYAAITAQQIPHWRDSIALFRHATDVDAENGVAHYNLAVALADVERWRDAIPEYREAARIHPDFGAAENGLGLALARTGDLDAALAAYERSVALEPNDPLYRRSHAELLLHLGRLEPAAEQLEASVRFAPEDPVVQRLLGDVLRRLGRLEQALRHLEVSVRLAPDDADTHLAQALVLRALGRESDAARQFAAAARLAPAAADRALRRGSHALARGDLAAGIEQLRIAVALAPLHTEALQLLAWTLATAPEPAQRSGTEAVTLAERASDLVQRADPIVLGTLAASYAEVGRFAEALAVVIEAESRARAQGRADVARRLEALHSSFSRNEPFHETPREVR